MTVTNAVNLFGIAPSNKWNAYNWNEFLWGEGTTDLVTETTKVLGNSVTISEAISKEVEHVFGSTISIGGDMAHRYVLNGPYFRVFPSDTTDIEGLDTPTWSTSTVTPPTWSTSTASGPTWS